jgi:hypothetical protein
MVETTGISRSFPSVPGRVMNLRMMFLMYSELAMCFFLSSDL